MTLLAQVVAASQRVAQTPSRLAKVGELAECIKRTELAEVPIAIAFLSGETRQGKLGVSYSALHSARAAPASVAPALSLTEVDAAFAELSTVKGKGAAGKREQHLQALFAQATEAEQNFLARLIVGELRQGALKALVLEALAAAAQIPLAEARRAAMSVGGLGAIAQIMLSEGAAGLAKFSIRLMQPVLPMLSQSADDIDAALEQFGTAAFEWKLDGARVQVHKADDEVRVYTRNLKDVTARVPEIVDTVRALPAQSLILDGEAIALRADGSPLSFQMTMRRFGRKRDVDAMKNELPLSVFFFDCLLRDSEVLVDKPAAERFLVLQALLPATIVIPRLVTDHSDEARHFLEETLRCGHEGVMAKSLAAPYLAGRRGANWLKIKRPNTLDLVVLAAEWGHGRRHGWLSNLHLGACDPESGGFVMLGKTFKGLTDEMLKWQTQEFLKHERSRDDSTVYLKPEIVVEIAFNEVQASSQYPGGLALRFARVKGYRPDKGPQEADTIEAVRAIYAAQVHAKALPQSNSAKNP